MTRLLALIALAACGTTAPSIDCATLDASLPAPRGELDGAWDSTRSRLLLFGGNTALPVDCAPGATDMVADLWAYHPSCNAFQAITPAGDTPRARARFAIAHDPEGDRILMHGGRYRDGNSGDYTVFSDTWALDLTTDTWTKLPTGGPPGRFDHAGAIVDGDFVIFGGNDSTDGAVIQPRRDAWSLDLDTLTWSKIAPADGPKPEPRTYVASASDGDRLFVYGGGESDALFGTFLGDLWALEPETGVWDKLKGDNKNAPEARIWADLVYDPGGKRLLLWAGHDDGSLGNTNAVWSFDMASASWTQLRAGDTFANPANDVCDFPADFTLVDPESPERREAGVAVWADDAAMIFGGKTDCGNVDDVWSFDPGASTWTELSAATTGEVCPRFADDCASMCF